MNEAKNDIGIIGLAAMGANLAMNFADHGFRTAIFNRSPHRTESLIASYGSGKNLDPVFTIEAFINSLVSPRKILLMVQAGESVDHVINSLLPLLSPGDTLIDGGNSFFKDTIRREAALQGSGIHFVGLGVSGGEEGARLGPSLMFGGSEAAWQPLQPLLEAVAATDYSGNPCVARLGEGGAGHYVKMVHNGIEYADMELIAETTFLLKHMCGYSNLAIADRLEGWNEGRLESFLIEISAHIFRTREKNGNFIIDAILDTAGSKGTGKWTAEEALELGEPAFSLATAVFARYASSCKNRRMMLSHAYKNMEGARAMNGTPGGEADIEATLYAGKLLSYAQGYDLLGKASAAYGWNLDFGEISRIWQGGCIIRARFLAEMERLFKETGQEAAILLSPWAQEILARDTPALRTVSSQAILRGIPIPGILSVISYFDTMRTDVLPANLIQAQRDFFGAHTFQRRIDGPYEHFNWQQDIRETDKMDRQ